MRASVRASVRARTHAYVSMCMLRNGNRVSSRALFPVRDGD